MFFSRKKTPILYNLHVTQIWIHPWIILTSLSYLYANDTEKLLCNSGPFYTGHLEIFHFLI